MVADPTSLPAAAQTASGIPEARLLPDHVRRPLRRAGEGIRHFTRGDGNARSVVDLDLRPPYSPDPIADPVPGGLLVATGRLPGLLKRWTRAVDGRWFGMVNFTDCDCDCATLAGGCVESCPRG